MTTRKPRIGRPPREARPSLERVEIRITDAELSRWRLAAKAAELTLSEFIRDSINRKVR